MNNLLLNPFGIGSNQRDENLSTTPAKTLAEYNQSIEKIFDNFFQNVPMFKAMEKMFPQVETKENKDSYTMEISSPYFKDDSEMDLSVKNGQLHISASSNKEEKNKNKDKIYNLFSQSSFEQTLPLPFNVNEKAIEASYEDGKLTIEVPKLQKQESDKYKVNINRSGKNKKSAA